MAYLLTNQVGVLSPVGGACISKIYIPQQASLQSTPSIYTTCTYPVTHVLTHHVMLDNYASPISFLIFIDIIGSKPV